jgi:short-chain Z-isoprenyl diphosphate synthase
VTADPHRLTVAAAKPGRLRLHGRVSRLLLAPLYSLYTSRLRREVEHRALPHHVAVILDGNRRWASLAGLEAAADGHRAGADKLDELLDWCVRIGIAQVTVWALSNENFSRPSDEVGGLIDVVADKLESLAALHSAQSVRIRVYGRRDGLPERLRDSIRTVEDATARNEGLRLNIALGYSGRDELVDATRALIRSLAARRIAAAEMADHVDADAIARHLYTAEHSDPDLIIRTSGEMRLSGFLPWQSSQSEFYFTDVYWPAFRELDFLRAVRTFQQRERRFGR